MNGVPETEEPVYPSLEVADGVRRERLLEAGDRVGRDAEGVDTHGHEEYRQPSVARDLAAHADGLLLGVGREDRSVDHAQDGGVERRARRRPERVLTIDRHRVLHQVVRADGKKVRLAGQLARDLDRGGELDHGADQRLFLRLLRRDLFEVILDQLPDAAELVDRADHRNQNAERTRARSECERLHLIPEHFRVVEEDADGSIAVERISARLEIRSRNELVAAEVEQSKDERLFGECLVRLEVDPRLLFSSGKVLADDKGKLRAVEPHTLGAVLLRDGEIGSDADIREELHATAILRSCRQVTIREARCALLRDPLRLFVVLVDRIGRRIDDDATARSIDDQSIARADERGDVGDSGDDRDVHRARQECAVGRRAARFGDQPLAIPSP